MPNYPDDEARYERAHAADEGHDPSDIDEDVAEAQHAAARIRPLTADETCIHGGQAPHRADRATCPAAVCDWLGLPA